MGIISEEERDRRIKEANGKVTDIFGNVKDVVKDIVKGNQPPKEETFLEKHGVSIVLGLTISIVSGIIIKKLMG